MTRIALTQTSRSAVGKMESATHTLAQVDGCQRAKVTRFRASIGSVPRTTYAHAALMWPLATPMIHLQAGFASCWLLK